MQHSPIHSSVIPQDIFLCVIYNKNEESLRKVLRCFLAELGKRHDCADHNILVEVLPLVGLRALFFLLIVIDPSLRYWAMQYESRSLQKPNPAKVCLFLQTLRDVIIPQWMSNERTNAAALVQNAKEAYIRC